MSGSSGANQQEKIASSAFEYIRRAVDLDSQLKTESELYSHRDELVALYTQGLELLTASLEHADEENPTSRALAQRVLRNYRTVNERIGELQKLEQPYIDPFSDEWNPSMDNQPQQPAPPASNPFPPAPGATASSFPPAPGATPASFPPAPYGQPHGGYAQHHPVITNSGGIAFPPAPTNSAFPPAPGVSASAFPPAPGVSASAFPPAPGVSASAFPPAPGVSASAFPPAPGASAFPPAPSGPRYNPSSSVPPQGPRAKKQDQRRQHQQEIIAALNQKQQAMGQLADEVSAAQAAYKRAKTPEERRLAYERLKNAMSNKARASGTASSANPPLRSAAPQKAYRPPPPTVASVPSFLDTVNAPPQQYSTPQPSVYQGPAQPPSNYGSSIPTLPSAPTTPPSLDSAPAKQQPAGPKKSPAVGTPEDKKRREELLRGVDKKLQQAILNDVVDGGAGVKWDDIGGLADVKRALYEAVIFPSLRPDLFMGIRAPPRGLLLFGPPGNGKTMIAKAVAQESKTTFFNISASSLTSKWVGEGEKMVKALFALARYLQPSVVFIDEVDSLLTERNSNEHDAMRRLKTEFLVQFDGVGTDPNERVFILGATNRPQDLDEAARRRFARCVYVHLPEAGTRKTIIQKLLKGNETSITEAELDEIARLTENYSGADLTRLCQEAALLPLRELSVSSIATVAADSVRPISAQDIRNAMKTIRATVSKESLASFERWNAQFGSLANPSS